MKTHKRSNKSNLNKVTINKEIVIGKIEFTRNGGAYLINPDVNKPDIRIAFKDTKPAFENDLVAVRITKNSTHGKPDGKVFKIIERHKTQFIGKIELVNSYAFVIVDNGKHRIDFYINETDFTPYSNGDLVLVEFKDWNETMSNPIAKLIRKIGKSGEHHAEMDQILFQFGLETQFPDDVISEANALNEHFTKDEIKSRRDFRNTLTFTIDPHDAKDFDDAISFKTLNDDSFEIGIHIADVSHFVKHNTSLDLEARKRATSVYLVDRVVPMLPEKLSNELCSLRPKEDKLCFSAVFTINTKAQIIDAWYGKTIIHSNHRFSYEEAQEIIQSKVGLYATELVILNDIAKKLKEIRFKNGAISFETEEVKFKLDETGKPIEVYKKIRQDAHKMIEEYMLLANRKISELVAIKYKPHSIPNRVHPEPILSKMSEFAMIASQFGYEVKIDSTKIFAKSVNQLTQDIGESIEGNIIKNLAIRSMEKAYYTSKKNGHFGLAFDFYSHFTSPIRRYPDLITHRLLFEYMNGAKNTSDEDLEKICKWSSDKEQNAVDAERNSIKYKQVEYLSDKIGNEYDGVISGITEWGIYVELLENKCEGMIKLIDLKGDTYSYNESKKEIIAKRSKKIYRMGHFVKVRVKQTLLNKKQIDFELVTT